MGFRFRKSAKVGPFRINFSKSGVGYSFGGKGFRVTKKAGGGMRTPASIPGSGISYVKDYGKGRKTSGKSPATTTSTPARDLPSVPTRPMSPTMFRVMHTLTLTICVILALCAVIVADRQAPGPSVVLVVIALLFLRSFLKMPSHQQASIEYWEAFDAGRTQTDEPVYEDQPESISIVKPVKKEVINFFAVDTQEKNADGISRQDVLYRFKMRRPPFDTGATLSLVSDTDRPEYIEIQANGETFGLVPKDLARRLSDQWDKIDAVTHLDVLGRKGEYDAQVYVRISQEQAKECEEIIKQEQDETVKKEAEKQAKIKKEEEYQKRLKEKIDHYNSMVAKIKPYEPTISSTMAPIVLKKDLPTITYSSITKKSSKDSLGNYVVVDTETTGLHPSSCEIIDIAAIRFRDYIPVEKFSMLLSSKKPIPEEATQVNGITNDMIAEQPKFQQVAESFLAFIKNDNLVGHNLPFDLSFIMRYGADVTREKRKYFDTLEIARKTIKPAKKKWDREFEMYETDPFSGVEDYKLKTLCIWYAIENPDIHRAESDAIATGLLFKRLVEERLK